MLDPQRYPLITISNGTLQLDLLRGAGPRITGFRYNGSANLFAKVPQKVEPTPIGDFHFIGGHRLWAAPEHFPLTYTPDNEGCEIALEQDGATLTGKAGFADNLRKTLRVRFTHDQQELEVTHIIENAGLNDVSLAPWAITMLISGGTVTIPLLDGSSSEEKLLPDRHLVFWPYTNLKDPRLEIDAGQVSIHATDGPPLKVGTFSRAGCLHYEVNGITFTKSFRVCSWRENPDLGCNTEVYCGNGFVELESLGPLVTLPPGIKTSWIETWKVSSNP